MTFDEFKDQAHQETEAILDKIADRHSRDKKSWACCCGRGDGLKKYNGFKLKCFSCDFEGDVIDYVGYLNNYSKADSIKAVADLMGVTMDNNRDARADFKVESRPATSNKPTYNIHNENTEQEQEQDYTAFYLEAHKNIKKTDYLKVRGLSDEIIERFNIGYVADWVHPKDYSKTPTPRIIIPIAKGHYIARLTTESKPKEEQVKTADKPKLKVGKIAFFNADALYNTTQEVIYVTEGEIDALSIIEVGGEAVATGSASYTNRFLEMLKEKPPVAPLLIAMDNDKRGQEAKDKLVKGLKELGIEHYVTNIAEECKDCNEALIKDRGIFTLEVLQGKFIPTAERQYQKDKYIEANSIGNYLETFTQQIEYNKTHPPISTGFDELDKVLEGGLYEGFTVIGAVSTLGKTTLMLQIADQIAKAGNDVLYYTLEMGKAELVAKSISRLTYKIVEEKGKAINLAKTNIGILAGNRYSNYSQEELDIIADATERYKKQVGSHLFIVEGVGNISVKEIIRDVKNHKAITGNAPVVFIDYMQILAPYDAKMDIKASTDATVVELKRLSRDLHIPVITVSSFNREGYKGKAEMRNFKESGAIEYTADILIGLWYAGADKQGYNEADAQAKNPREIKATILKNRNGRTGASIEFDYYPMFNYFEQSIDYTNHQYNRARDFDTE